MSYHYIDIDKVIADGEYTDGVVATCNEIMNGAPESWDGDDSIDHITIQYVRTIERRLISLGGSLERHVEDPRTEVASSGPDMVG